MKNKKQVSVDDKYKDKIGKGGKDRRDNKRGSSKDDTEQSSQSLLDIRNHTVSKWLNSIDNMTKAGGLLGIENPTVIHDEIRDFPGRQEKKDWENDSIASSMSERRYDDFAGVEKAKWMELLDLRVSRQKEKEMNKDEYEDRASDRHDSFSKDFFKPALRLNSLQTWGGIWGHDVFEDLDDNTDFGKSKFDDKFSDIHSSIGKRTFYTSSTSAVSREKTLRRRNTVVVIMITIAILAAIAVAVGTTLYFMYPKAILRAHVTLTIDNRNFTEAMKNKTSLDYHSIAVPMCQEMNNYFFTSEFENFYLRCRTRQISNDRGKVGLYYIMDFLDNIHTRDPARIEDIIISKSGRIVKDNRLYLLIREFLVYVKSITITVETILSPVDIPLPVKPSKPKSESGETSEQQIGTTSGRDVHVISTMTVEDSYNTNSKYMLYHSVENTHLSNIEEPLTTPKLLNNRHGSGIVVTPTNIIYDNIKSGFSKMLGIDSISESWDLVSPASVIVTAPPSLSTPFALPTWPEFWKAFFKKLHSTTQDSGVESINLSPVSIVTSSVQNATPTVSNENLHFLGNGNVFRLQLNESVVVENEDKIIFKSNRNGTTIRVAGNSTTVDIYDVTAKINLLENSTIEIADSNGTTIRSTGHHTIINMRTPNSVFDITGYASLVKVRNNGSINILTFNNTIVSIRGNDTILNINIPSIKAMVIGDKTNLIIKKNDSVSVKPYDSPIFDFKKIIDNSLISVVNVSGSNYDITKYENNTIGITDESGTVIELNGDNSKINVAGSGTDAFINHKTKEGKNEKENVHISNNANITIRIRGHSVVNDNSNSLFPSKKKMDVTLIGNGNVFDTAVSDNRISIEAEDGVRIFEMDDSVIRFLGKDNTINMTGNITDITVSESNIVLNITDDGNIRLQDNTGNIINLQQKGTNMTILSNSTEVAINNLPVNIRVNKNFSLDFREENQSSTFLKLPNSLNYIFAKGNGSVFDIYLDDVTVQMEDDVNVTIMSENKTFIRLNGYHNLVNIYGNNTYLYFNNKNKSRKNVGHDEEIENTNGNEINLFGFNNSIDFNKHNSEVNENEKMTNIKMHMDNTIDISDSHSIKLTDDRNKTLIDIYGNSNIFKIRNISTDVIVDENKTHLVIYDQSGIVMHANNESLITLEPSKAFVNTHTSRNTLNVFSGNTIFSIDNGNKAFMLKHRYDAPNISVIGEGNSVIVSSAQSKVNSYDDNAHFILEEHRHVILTTPANTTVELSDGLVASFGDNASVDLKSSRTILIVKIDGKVQIIDANRTVIQLHGKNNSVKMNESDSRIRIEGNRTSVSLKEDGTISFINEDQTILRSKNAGSITKLESDGTQIDIIGSDYVITSNNGTIGIWKNKNTDIQIEGEGNILVVNGTKADVDIHGENSIIHLHKNKSLDLIIENGSVIKTKGIDDRINAHDDGTVIYMNGNISDIDINENGRINIDINNASGTVNLHGDNNILHILVNGTEVNISGNETEVNIYKDGFIELIQNNVIKIRLIANGKYLHLSSSGLTLNILGNDTEVEKRQDKTVVTFNGGESKVTLNGDNNLRLKNSAEITINYGKVI